MAENTRVVLEVSSTREFEVGEHEIGGTVLLVGAGRADQFMDDLVQGRSEPDIAPPVVQRGTIDHLALVAPADGPDRPLGGEVLGEIGMVEQVLDHFAPLVRFLGIQERPGFLHGRDAADQVEIATEEFLVGRAWPS